MRVRLVSMVQSKAVIVGPGRGPSRYDRMSAGPRKGVAAGGYRMEQLWAPWRLAYVVNPRPPSGDEPCFLCTGLADADDRRNLVALPTPLSVVVLNRFPYNNGHLLVAPRAHKATLDDLAADELMETMETLRRMVRTLDRLMKPDGYNIGLNLGRAAGAGLPGHLHWHIVPRWQDDTNFMPLCADVKVIVQSLDTLYELLVTQLREEGDKVRQYPSWLGSASPRPAFPAPPGRDSVPVPARRSREEPVARLC